MTAPAPQPGPKRILYLNPIGNIGGAERVLLTALAGVRREMPEAKIRVIALSDGPLMAAAKDLGAEVAVVALPASLAKLGDSRGRGHRTLSMARSLGKAPALAGYLRTLGTEIAAFAPDVVHSNGIKTHLFTRFAVPARIPVVWHAHDFYGSRRLAGWLLRRASRRVRVVVAISKAVAEDARRVLPGTRVETVLNAVDLDRFQPGPGDGNDLDRRAGLPPAPEGTVRVGLLATYARWKGQLTVLDAAAQLAADARGLSLRWYIVGGPIYHTAAQFTEGELRSEAERRGLADRIGFIPFAADAPAIFRSLDIVVHASTQPEPFGLTVAEAMACGRPVVVSAAGGAAELFTDGVDAAGFPPGDPHRLAETVRRLAADGEMRSRLGRAARATAGERFDSRRYGREIAAVYRSAMPGATGGAAAGTSKNDHGP
jgi:glycosyltransferase involved in cell wall biosynthesis